MSCHLAVCGIVPPEGSARFSRSIPPDVSSAIAALRLVSAGPLPLTCPRVGTPSGGNMPQTSGSIHYEIDANVSV